MYAKDFPYDPPERLWEYESHRMTEDEKLALGLRTEGYSIKEISGLMDSSTRYISKLLKEAIVKIKEANE